jgi:two-component system LytT family sensor kinase
MRASRLRRWIIGFGFCTGVGLINFSYRYLDRLARQDRVPFLHILVEEVCSMYGVGLLLPLLFWYTRWLRRRNLSLLTTLLLHLPGLAVYSFLHTSWNAIMRPILFRLAGLGGYDYGVMRWRYPMELSIDTIGYITIVSFIVLWDRFRRSQADALRLARLERELSEAKLQSLQSQLHPHFLFNALNTVSSVMYDDVAAADRMLARLSDLLRRTLQASESAEIPLAEEVDLLEHYLDILRARFSDRLTVRLEIATQTRDAAVPQLLLQPLVENAVKHGDPGPGQPAIVTVTAARQDGRLLLEVRDNGPGLTEGKPKPSGIGLSNTRRRLEALYGDNQSLTIGSAPEGGCLVRLDLPFRSLRSNA